MKQKDIALILIICIISGMISFFVAQFVFTPAKDRNTKAERVSPISVDFNQPSSKYFNNDSLNPTRQIEIGGSTNVTPFSGR